MHAHLTHLSEPSTTLQGLTEQAAFFLLSICIRSAEGRRRIVSEIVHTLNPSDKSEQRPEEQGTVRRAASNPYKVQPGFPAPHKVLVAAQIPVFTCSAAQLQHNHAGNRLSREPDVSLSWQTLKFITLLSMRCLHYLVRLHCMQPHSILCMALPCSIVLHILYSCACHLCPVSVGYTRW